MTPEHPHAIIDRVVREEWSSALAILLTRTRDIQLAEDALQDALVVALNSWQQSGIPNSPRAWLIKVAWRKVIDQVRRRESFRSKQNLIVTELANNQSTQADSLLFDDDASIPDERLRLIFTCCHPALPLEARVPLTLQTLGGLSTEEIAKAFLVPLPTMAQRLVRAKRKIKDAGIPYEVPQAEQVTERTSGVLKVLYLIFNHGYSSLPSMNSEARLLCERSINMTRVLAKLMPTHSEAAGLLAMMLLHHSRSPARTNDDGELIILSKQDRSLWDQSMIIDGHQVLNIAIASRQPGPYILQAAISALHTEAKDHDSTDWPQIHQLYLRLHAYDHDPIVLLNAAVALSYTGDLENSYRGIESLADVDKMKHYTPYYAAQADISRRLGRIPEAQQAYEKAITATDSPAERALFSKRITELQEL